MLLRRGGAGYRILREVHVLEAASRRPFPIRVGVRPLLHFLLANIFRFPYGDTAYLYNSMQFPTLLSASQTMQLDAP